MERYAGQEVECSGCCRGTVVEGEVAHGFQPVPGKTAFHRADGPGNGLADQGVVPGALGLAHDLSDKAGPGEAFLAPGLGHVSQDRSPAEGRVQALNREDNVQGGDVFGFAGQMEAAVRTRNGCQDARPDQQPELLVQAGGAGPGAIWR